MSKSTSRFDRFITPNREKIYIIPTRMGGYFITVTLIILLVGSGYSNNLVNILAFFMLSLVFVGMVMTHLQLKQLNVDEAEVNPSFAHSELWAHALVNNAASDDRFGIRLEFRGLFANSKFLHSISGRQNTRVSWAQKSGQRGRHTLEKIEISSIFPLGFFYSWKVLPTEVWYWVYPALVGEIPLPDAMKSGEADALSRSTLGAGDDFRGHRKYSEGDSSRHIDWKAHARGRPLLIKEINEGDPPDWFFDYSAPELNQLDHEAKLSQLTVWVNLAYQRDLNFSLRLSGRDEISGRGDAHAKRCFEALAVYEAIR